MSETERAKTVAESRVETYHLIRPEDLNDAGRLFGGRLVEWIDEVAAMVGRRHARMPITTASIDNLKFLHPAFKGDIVILNGKVTHVGNTSMEVKVETYVEDEEGRSLINRAFLTLVGLDGHNHPAALPSLIVETDEEKTEWERAEQRRRIRKEQRKEGFHFYGDNSTKN
ncbi:MAG: acyl-CoA thioesterase [Eubacterium sp.]|nr:acyl-CoA thioesterase [Eubacterium sp.]